MKETVYEHVSNSGTFTITAAERWSITMIRRLKDKYPDDVEIRHTNADGSIVAHLPSSWMRIIPKRKVNLTDAERQELVNRFKSHAERGKKH